ncbi:MAG: 2,3-diphosphoglycerate-dependent phosphoglycerate mutase [Thermodesulfobacteriota bacterium]
MYRVVFLRHGQSTWNQENRFTGWTDVPLSANGEQEALAAARQLRQKGFSFDCCYTSYLQRAIKTLWIALEDLGAMWLPVEKHWRLNERHYGALQGEDKAATAALYGEKQVFQWRRSYAVRPPALPDNAPRLPELEPRYADLPAAARPRTESLADTVERVLPYWEARIAPAILGGRQVFIVAHGNSLRALVKHLEGLSEEAITKRNIPTGVPLVYELDGDLRVVRWYYLPDPEK